MAKNIHLNKLLNLKLTRRQLLWGSAGVGIVAGTPALIHWMSKRTENSSLTFDEIAHPGGPIRQVHVPDDYHCQTLLRWGDALFDDAPAFDPLQQTAETQAKQFGFNNDFVAYIPLNGSSEHGLLCVNHEYTSSDMFPQGAPLNNEDKLAVATKAVGHSVVEIIRRESGDWETVTNSRYNRRITATTAMAFDGPATKDHRLKLALHQSHSDNDKQLGKGTLANCAGGITPWGTILSAEENFDSHFILVQNGVVLRNDDNAYRNAIRRLHEGSSHQIYNVAKRPYNDSWLKHDERWDIAKNPAVPLQFGWIVEIDPFDPQSTPIKHTALGRFKHEACTIYINDDGKVVAYMGDDEYDQYLYRFVSAGRYVVGNADNADNARANRQLLSAGTLSVAQFDEQKVRWLPLIYGEGPLTRANKFNSQADVLLDTRKAARLLEATPMARPEDVETNPHTGTVFVVLTGDKRSAVNAANPRPQDHKEPGHILELSPPGNDHTADAYDWDVFLLAGGKENQAQYGDGTSKHGQFAKPDNVAFDQRGRLWIASDNKKDNGVWACDIRDAGRAATKRFLIAPQGAEVCGPAFTPDNRYFFCAIQHPEAGWPDDSDPARPAVVAVSHNEGKVIGS